MTDADDGGNGNEDSQSDRRSRFGKLSDQVRGSQPESTGQPTDNETIDEREESDNETDSSATDDVDSWDWVDDADDPRDSGQRVANLSDSDSAPGPVDPDDPVETDTDVPTDSDPDDPATPTPAGSETLSADRSGPAEERLTRQSVDLWGSKSDADESPDELSDPGGSTMGDELTADDEGRAAGASSTEPREPMAETDGTTIETGGATTDVSGGETDGFAAESGVSATKPDESRSDRRIWSERRQSSPSVESAPGPSRSVEASESLETSDPADAFTQELNDADGFTRPQGISYDPGTSMLIQCSSQDDRRHAARMDLLEAADAEPNALLIRYRKLKPERLEQIAAAADQTKLISVGYSQPVPGSLRETVETVEINNPNDVTRLGILVSGTVNDWADAPGETVVFFDSINTLLKYKDSRSTFRFLHILLGTLDRAVSQFYADPIAGNVQDINTLKPLFDENVSIDDVGVTVE